MTRTIIKTDRFCIEERTANGHTYYVMFVPGGWSKCYNKHQAFAFCYSFFK